MSHGPNWHGCYRWRIREMPCPFPGEEDREESDEDAKASPSYWLIAAAVASLEILRRHEKGVRSKYDVLSEAEDVVARHAEKVPMPLPRVGEPVSGSLREALGTGATAATGLAAAWAIRQVVRSGRTGGGGGYFFQSRPNPLKAALPR